MEKEGRVNGPLERKFTLGMTNPFDQNIGPVVASTTQHTNVEVGWNRILADAEAGLAEAQSRVRYLKRAIRTLREKIDTNTPYPLA
jgi:hypothetical protein